MEAGTGDEEPRFNPNWCGDSYYPQLNKWIRPVQNDGNRALCVYCQTTFSLGEDPYLSVLEHLDEPEHLRIEKEKWRQELEDYLRANGYFGSQTQDQVEDTHGTVDPDLKSGECPSKSEVFEGVEHEKWMQRITEELVASGHLDFIYTETQEQIEETHGTKDPDLKSSECPSKSEMSEWVDHEKWMQRIEEELIASGQIDYTYTETQEQIEDTHGTKDPDMKSGECPSKSEVSEGVEKSEEKVPAPVERVFRKRCRINEEAVVVPDKRRKFDL